MHSALSDHPAHMACPSVINAGLSNTAGTRLILQLLRAGPLSSQLLLQLRLGGSGGEGL